MMDSRTILLKTLRQEATPRPAVALLSGGVWTFNRRGLSLQEALEQPEEAAAIIAATNEEVRSDIVWAGSGYHNLAIRALGGEIKFRAKGAPDVLGPVLKEAAEGERISLDRLHDDRAIRGLWQTAGLLAKEIGSHTLVGASQWGPFTLAGHFYGVERLMRSLYKDPDAALAVLEFTSELCFRYLAPFLAAGAEILSIADPSASGDLISRPQFERFVVPALAKTIAKLKAEGALICLHICGNITGRLDLIPPCGADLLSVDYKVDLGRVKEAVGAKIAYAGNMNPVAIMQNATPEGVAAACRDCLEKTDASPGYILMPGCDIPPGVPLANVQAMVETAHHWQERKG
ncbi:MAG: uroporphyrinogen decarboxylase family protein [Deltaproteobacteria bacterium]|nr:uroporphyrinogen decarboxylase family protein [Deltaproteobacteria bacterium]